MNTKAETGPRALDTVKLIAAVLVLLGSFFGYYWFSDASTVLRVLGLVAGLALGLLIASQSMQGKQTVEFIKGSQIEIRKVVWPDMEETRNTTLLVLAFTILLGVFFLGVDAALLWVRNSILGLGG